MNPGDAVYVLGHPADVPATVVSSGDGYVRVDTGFSVRVLEQHQVLGEKNYTRAVLSCVVAARIEVARSRRYLPHLNPLELQHALEKAGLSRSTAWACVLLFDAQEWAHASLPMTLWLKRIRDHFFVSAGQVPTKNLGVAA